MQYDAVAGGENSPHGLAEPILETIPRTTRLTKFAHRCHVFVTK